MSIYLYLFLATIHCTHRICAKFDYLLSEEYRSLHSITPLDGLEKMRLTPTIKLGM